MANLRLYRSESAPSAFAFRLAVDLGERGYFRGVADARACAVGLDHLDGVRFDSCNAIGFANRFDLPRGAGSVDGVAATIARRTHAAQDRIDAVAVAPGIGKAFQHHHAQPFAEDRTVGGGVERPGIPRRRQRRRLAETHVHKNIIERIHAAAQHHIGAARRQFQGGKVDGAQRGGAGGIDDAIGAAQIEAIGDASGHHVAEQSRKRVFLPADVRIADAPHHILGDPFLHTRFVQGASPDRMTEPRSEGDH